MKRRRRPELTLGVYDTRAGPPPPPSIAVCRLHEIYLRMTEYKMARLAPLGARVWWFLTSATEYFR